VNVELADRSFPHMLHCSPRPMARRKRQLYEGTLVGNFVARPPKSGSGGPYRNQHHGCNRNVTLTFWWDLYHLLLSAPSWSRSRSGRRRMPMFLCL
jgi:hypothetical protein